MVPIQVGAAGLAVPLVVLVVLVLGAYVVFRRVEGDAQRARQRTERTSRKAAGGLVAAGLGVLAGLAGVWDEVATGLGEAVAFLGTPGGETIASGAAGAFTAYALSVTADFPITSALVSGIIVFALAVGVTRS